MDERTERFSRLFTSTYPAVWTYARRRLPDEIEDVVADVMTVAWRRLDDVPPGAELPWLYGVAFNTIAARRRAHARRLRLVSRLAAEPAAASPSSDEHLEVREALAMLRPEDQEVLRLAAWEGLQPADIAVVLGCSANAAALKLSRARKKLRERLTGSGASRTHARRKEIDA